MANGPKSRIDWREGEGESRRSVEAPRWRGGRGEEESKVPKAHFCWSAKGSKSLGTTLAVVPKLFELHWHQTRHITHFACVPRWRHPLQGMEGCKDMVAKVHSKLCIPILHAMLASTRSFEKTCLPSGLKVQNIPKYQRRAEAIATSKLDLSTAFCGYLIPEIPPPHWRYPLHPLPRICDHQRDNDVGKGPGDLSE